MRTNSRNLVLAFAGGAVAGAMIYGIGTRNSAPEPARMGAGAEPREISAPRHAASAEAPVARDVPVLPRPPIASTNTGSVSGPSGPASATERLANTEHLTKQGQPIPPAILSDDLESRPAGLGGLLDASSLRCDIDVAHGANWSQGRATLHAISYQGGPFSIDSIDLEAETATMSGGSGVTGSLTGELEMRTTAGDKGLTFSAFTSRGDLLIVTVYPALDSRGRYRSVMTTFGDRFDHETAQFFGACDISLAKR